MKDELHDEYGIEISIKRITRLMKENNLDAKGIKKFKVPKGLSHQIKLKIT
ncbi:transposase [uncultured Ilyobacter sp.]|uniref:transposase n=1 Tax=uncultured Ilyobacter sp. TaxID=544433 RepID=UPI0029F4CD49|nr:transposase [uncultured Ilyobacter sp.]